MKLSLKLKVEAKSSTPVFQQIVEQVHFQINSGELTAGSKLPSIRALAQKHKLALNTVAKAMRQLEFRGLIQAQPRSGYVVVNKDASIGRYQARGVSSDKTEVQACVLQDHRRFPHRQSRLLQRDPRRWQRHQVHHRLSRLQGEW